jgi:NADH:ubiquinone oxidoreductase subunit 6 (subunit J)
MLFLGFLLFGSVLLMCTLINPVESVLFLILVLCNIAAITLLFNAEFLGSIFIIIYVEAIAALFLFVIIMLNIKNKKDKKENSRRMYYFLYFFSLT